MAKTSISWTEFSWNPVRGCTRVSPGCVNCYAERMAARFSDPGMWGHGFARMTPQGPRWTGRVELVPEKLDEPLRLRKPQRIFVNSTSDLFHEALSFEDIARVYGVMTCAQQHTFQVLTKRPARRLEFHAWREAHREQADELEFYAALACEIPRWPLPNVWEGTSVEDQKTADERVPLLLKTPAAVRFVSYEPALGPVDIPWLRAGADADAIDLVIVGGASGPGAQPCDVAWIRSVVRQCREAGVACFVKQLGARPFVVEGSDASRWWASSDAAAVMDDCGQIHCKHPKGGEPAEWPEDLRVREPPE